MNSSLNNNTSHFRRSFLCYISCFLVFTSKKKLFIYNMYAQLFKYHQFCLHPINVIISIFLLTLIPRNYAQDDYAKLYSVCKGTTDATCGKLKPGYPFWVDGIQPKYCGIEELKLSCENSELFIHFGSVSKYHVTDINLENSTLEVERSDDLIEDICVSDTKMASTKLNETLFRYGGDTEVLHFFYNCPSDIYLNYVEESSTCPNGDTDRKVIFGNDLFFKAQGDNLSSCKNITVPVRKIEPEILPVDVEKLQELFNRSFQVHYYIDQKACNYCTKTKGLCWRDTNLPTNHTCLYKGKNKNLEMKLVAVSGAAGATVLVLLLLIYLRYCHQNTEQNSSLFPTNVSSYPKDVEAFLRQYGSSTPQRFTYPAVKKMTNSFKDELGKGGYGSVYKGCLPDGRAVAVKVLNAIKGNGEDFLNEVASIGRTSHVNVVKLLGFCYEGKKRALIYDYMPNGSLEKFIYGKLPTMEGQHLGWEKLYSIALGIAQGLDYLHRGCNTRILHFDIKPHNILLDKDFRPKISDFGLAKLYNENESNVSSIMQPRGTTGYIAPEVFSRSFGQVSHKSDVYSYGMMILEMVGGRKNVHAGAGHTSEIYYPRWLYKRIAFSEELCFGSEMSEEETEIARKMVIVGLWCIQTNPAQRPYICKVIEMLEGRTASLEMPPKPYLCSGPNSPSNSPTKPHFSSSSITDSNSSLEAVSRLTTSEGVTLEYVESDNVPERLITSLVMEVQESNSV